MPRIDFTCPKCGEEAIADVPPGGARVECPSCGARVRVNAPAQKPTPKRAKAVVADDDEIEEVERPRRKKGKKSQKAAGGVPVWAWVAGGGGLLAVVGLVLALTLGGGNKPDDQAAANPNPPDQAAPVEKTPNVPVDRPKKDAPKKTTPNPSKKERPKTSSPVASEADIDRDWPELPPRKRRSEPADAPSRTIVRWFTSTAGGAPRVVLDAPTEPVPPRPGPYRGLLARELARQAVSLAARDEFGASTRDAALGEPAGDLAGFKSVATFELTWLAIPGQLAKASLAVVTGEARRVVWEQEIPLPDADVLDYLAIAATLEGAARGPLADALAKETGIAKAPAPPSDAKTPPEAGTALTAVNYFDLTAAVRRIHTAIRSQGESPTLLTDLARGYAALGLVTEHLDIPTHKAFKARGLLYANRAIARNAPAGKWALAYAVCLTGLHGRALELVRAARGEPPGWAKVIEPSCRHDHAALHALPADEVGPVAGVLRFIAAENNYTPSHPIGIGREFLEKNRDCFRVYDGVTRIAGLGLERLLTDEGPAVLSTAIARRLAKMPDLPNEAAAVLDRVGNRDATSERTLLRTMDAAGPGEPSLAVLSALVREERFRQLEHRVIVYDLRLNLEAAAVEEIRKALPYLEDHPRREEFARRLAPVPKTPVNVADRPLPEELLYGVRLREALALAHADDVDMDLRRVVSRLKPEERPGYVTKFFKVSPYSPTARFHLIGTDWAKAEPDAGKWEKEYAAHPALLAALGQKYLDLGRHDDAERLFRSAVRLAPENRCYFALATIYGQVRKDEAKMLAVMEERLKFPDYGVEVARMRVRIAEVFAGRKDYKTALQYAEKAAEDSGAEWAMRAAITYANQLGDRARATMWEQRRRERYGGGMGNSP